MKILGSILLGLLGVGATGTWAAGQTQKTATLLPGVSHPVTGGRGQPFAALASVPPGYLEEERFLSGIATSYARVGRWDIDGIWAVKPASTAAYTVRVLIRRPTDANRFNGIVIVEWLNVTAQSEGAADFMQMQEEIVREGYAWVGVGAQAVGVNAPRTGLKAWDAERYASLSHPGDAYSYDIFSQAAGSLRPFFPSVVPPAVTRRVEDPLGGLRAAKVLATGRSQSAFRLVTYINAIHPTTRVFDGYFVHSRGSNAAGLSAEGLLRDATDPIPAGARIRSDIDVPVFDLQTEGDMVALRSHLTRQDAGPRYRRWELAGAAHAETPRWVVEEPPPLDRGQGCSAPVNAAPHHAFVKAGLRALTKWVREGVAPPQSPAIELSDPAAPDPIVRDSFGNAKGGVRLPEVEAPTATIDGTRNDVAKPAAGAQNFCFLFGRTVPFKPETLATLYPSHDAFVKRFTAAVDALEKTGYLLAPEAEEARKAAMASRIGR